MVAPTTFREAQLQLQDLPVLPNKPIDPCVGARGQRVNIDGKERIYYSGITPERVQNFIRDNASYHHQKICNMEKVNSITKRVFNLLSTHIENEIYASPEERHCLTALKEKIQDNGMEFEPTEKTDDEFEVKLTEAKQTIQRTKSIVEALHRNLYEETHPLDVRVRALINDWDIQPACAVVERELHELQKNEINKLVRDADNPDQYSITRHKVRERIVRINELSKSFQRIRDSHPVDPEKLIEPQIRAAYAEHVTWESRKAMAKSIVFFPFKLMGKVAWNFPKTTTVATVAMLAYFKMPYVSSFIQAAKTPETYRPVVEFASALWNMGNFTR